MAARTAWRICSDNGWWSAFGKKRGKNGKKPGPPVHDDLCAVTDEKGRIRHEFTADAPNQLWIGDITEHFTGEGKLYVCAFKDVSSNPIVGYCIDSRMKSRLAVAALNSAVARRGDVADVWSTRTGARNFAAGNSCTRSTVTAWSDQWVA
jgi:transposase InsO family protein